MGQIGYVKAKEGIEDLSSQELSFLIWKAELNKELLSFWKAMGEE